MHARVMSHVLQATPLASALVKSIVMPYLVSDFIFTTSFELSDSDADKVRAKDKYYRDLFTSKDSKPKAPAPITLENYIEGTPIQLTLANNIQLIENTTSLSVASPTSTYTAINPNSI